MRTTIDLDSSVLRQLKRRSRRTGKSMGQVASELLARSLDQAELESKADEPIAWIAKELGRPAVDLEDKEALRAILDEPR